jgi:myosin heavy subunit
MISTYKIYEDLRQTLDDKAAQQIAHHLGAVYEDLQQTATKSDLAELRGVVKELAEAQKELAQAQKRTEQRVEELAEAQKELAEAQKRTEQRVEELAEAQKRTEAGLNELRGTVNELAQAQKRTEERVGSLETALERLAEAVQELSRIARAHENRLAKLDGRTLESQFREKASAYLGTVLRRTRVVPVGDLADDLEEVLKPEEWADLVEADVILRGRAQIEGQQYEAYAVVEVSVTLGTEDVERAARRAALLRKKGWKAIAVAAGEEADPRLIETAAAAGVAVLQDGRQFNWGKALAAA